jgi:glycosyltransferase involved in cell wall biosynthesis
MSVAVPRGPLVILYDRIADLGGAERYWETVLPPLIRAGVDVRLFARVVDEPLRFGLRATEIGWADEEHDGSCEAADRVAAAIRESSPATVVTASVFDAAVLGAVRAGASYWVARVHDHRAFCPTGDRVFPQFPGICEAPMGTACAVNALLRGCVHGPRPSTGHAIARRRAVRDALAQADRVLVSSDAMRRTAAANGIAVERISVTPPPLPDDAYREIPLARPAHDALLFAGRLVPNKGLRSLIAALSRIAPERRPRLVVAGRGETEERAARTDAARRGVAVDWRGWLDIAELRAAIDETSAVVMPSLWPEPFGLCGIEAQARGRPAIAFDVGGIGEWIDGAGIRVPYGDDAALARGIERLLRADVWPALAQAAHRRSERWRLDRHVAQMLTLLGGPDAVQFAAS